MRHIHLLYLLLLTLVLVTFAPGCGTDEPFADSEENGIVYPTKEWAEAAPEDLGMDPDGLETLQRLFESHIPGSLLVTRRGYIVWEKYYRGYSRETRFETFSVTKSFTSALAGIAIAEGLCALDQSASDFIDSWRPPDPRSAIGIQDLLTMTSGLHWSWGEYLHVVLSFPIGPFPEDLLRYGLTLPLDHAPGSHWTYNNCALMVLDHILSQATGMELREFARKRLFEPIGMHSVSWLADGKGHTYTFMGIEATARDLARFGYLFLRCGSWEGHQIVPRDWVLLTTKPYSDLNPAYGYLWWVNGYAENWKPMEGQPRDHLPKTGYYLGNVAPTDSYAALGAFGQMIAVIPELDLVMVRNGGSEFYDFREVFTLLYETVIQ